MPKQLLNRSNIIVRLEQMAGKTVTKGMSRGPLTDPCLADRLFDRRLHMSLMQAIWRYSSVSGTRVNCLANKNHSQTKSFTAFGYFFSDAFTRNAPP